MRRFVLTVLVLGLSAYGFAQDMETKATDNYIYEGNNLHQNESFVEAEKEYRKAIGHYNTALELISDDELLLKYKLQKLIADAYKNLELYKHI